jgi:TP901-1 family phage major tail protein
MDLLIKMDMTGDGQFETVAGLRATRLGFNAETVDVTSLESEGRWRELLAGAGVRSASISGSGVFRDGTTDRARAAGLLRWRSAALSGGDPRFRHGRGAVPDHVAGICGQL